MPADPFFITTIYGQAYAPFLLPHLHSIAGAYPHARGLVLWADMPESEIAILAAAFPSWTFRPTSLNIEGGLHQRIARKLHCWREACQLLTGAEPGAGPMCFIDCDTLVVRPFDHLLQDDAAHPPWDVIFTWKDELFPINTGVMLVRDAATGHTLFEELARRVEGIIRNDASLQVALGSSGAADQHALREIIGFVHYDRPIVRTVGSREMNFRGLPCRALNETNCRAITDDLCIIHYKTGWHPILFQGAPFTKNRPESRCREMLDHFWRTDAAAARAAAAAVCRAAARAAVAAYRPLADSYEQRGILQSEMLAACGLCSALDVDVIIESGRARGQSTRMLARFFAGTKTRIVSVEQARDDDALFAESRLKEFPHVELLYGDSFRVLPELLAYHAGRRIAILLDGPKGNPAIQLIDRCMQESHDVVAAMLHDTRRATPQRDALEASARRVFFTDDAEFIDEFRHLDAACLPGDNDPITVHTWRPHMKGQDPIQSYGPTLALFLRRPAQPAAAPAPAPSTAA